MIDDILHTLTTHATYAWLGLGLVIALSVTAYFKLRVTVPQNWILHTDDRVRPLPPGRHFMPYEYERIDMRERHLEIGMDDLQTVSRVDTYRDGMTRPSKESVVTRAAARPTNPIVVKWKPDISRLTDYCQHERSRTFEEAVERYFRVHPVSDGTRTPEQLRSHLWAWLRDMKLGRVIIGVEGAATKNARGRVVLAESVEIPYEG